MSTIVIVEFRGIFKPILDGSISYPNPKLTCYAKIQCRLQELWPLEGYSVKIKILIGIFFFLFQASHIICKILSSHFE